MLHEVLAVVGGLKGAKEKIHNETYMTFTKRMAHFNGMHKKLEMFDVSKKQEEVEEHSALVTTVDQKLEYMRKSFEKFWDAKLQKERGAQEARADIIIDDVVIASEVPVYFLLEMEVEVKSLREVYEAIPTLQPGIEWKKDENLGEGIWRAVHKLKKQKTEKVHKHKVMVPATDHHPAQVREWTQDEPIGEFIEDKWTGMLSPAEKSILLEKIDKLGRAIKRARQRANKQELGKDKIGSAIFNYIHSK